MIPNTYRKWTREENRNGLNSCCWINAFKSKPRKWSNWKNTIINIIKFTVKPRELMLKLENKMGRVKMSGVGGGKREEKTAYFFSPPLFPSFALAPTLRVLFLLSLIFVRHNKDGGYNITNIKKQLSPAPNTPALQATWPLGFRLAPGAARHQASAVSKKVRGLPWWEWCSFCK